MKSVKKPFKKIYVEISNVCNLACSFCPPLERAPKVMSPEAFRQVCQAIKPYTDYIYMHLMGEPLLHPKLDALLSIAQEEGLIVQLTSNGTLIREKTTGLLGQSALRQVNFSLSSFEANAVKTSLEEYLDPILNFSKLASERGKPYISLRLWNLDSKQFKGENALNALFFKYLESSFNLTFDLEAFMENHEAYELIKGVYLNKAEKFAWPNEKAEASGEVLFCYGLKDHIGILADGTVVPCCLDHAGSIKLGNILEQPLDMILTSERAEHMRRGFANRKASEHLCKTCGYATRF